MPSTNMSALREVKRRKHNVATKASRKKLNDHIDMLLELVSSDKESNSRRSKVRALQYIIMQVQKLQAQLQSLESRLLLADKETFERWLDSVLQSRNVKPMSLLTNLCYMVSQYSSWKIAEIWHVFTVTQPHEYQEAQEKVVLKLVNSFATKDHYLGEKNFLEGFLVASQDYEFQPNKGLPGKVYGHETPVWLNQLPVNPIFLRAPLAHKFGINSGLGIPFVLFGRVRAVLVFLDTVPRDEDSSVTRRLVEVFQLVSHRWESTLSMVNVDSKTSFQGLNF
eukprot:jgi/Galph1/1197/GphlegSOOS_G6052.1